MTIYLFAQIKHDHLVRRRVSNSPVRREHEIEISTVTCQPEDYFKRVTRIPEVEYDEKEVVTDE